MPFGKNPWWVYVASFLPALLVTILIFMDQQISAVIVNRKENKLKVGVQPVKSTSKAKVTVTKQRYKFRQKPINSQRAPYEVAFYRNDLCLPCRKAVAITWICSGLESWWPHAPSWVCPGTWLPPSSLLLTSTLWRWRVNRVLQESSRSSSGSGRSTAA